MTDALRYTEWGNLIHQVLLYIGLLAGMLAVFHHFKPTTTSRYKWLVIILGLWLMYMFGNCPIPWGAYSDRDNYANRIRLISLNMPDDAAENADPFFYSIMWIVTRFVDFEKALAFISICYVGFYIIAVRKIGGSNQLWLFVTIIMGFQFVAYGINTMRAGVAMAAIYLALSYYPNKKKMLIWSLLAILTHLSMAIPVLMLALCYIYRDTKVCLLLWTFSIPVSFLAGSWFNEVLAGIISDDQRSQYLLTDNELYNSGNTGFRIDFIIYSLVPILVGSFYIFHQKYKSRFYTWLFNSYIMTNLLWILVITANYSDRFAALSWFLIPLLLTYPLIDKPNIVRNPNIWIASILLGSSVFTLLFI